MNKKSYAALLALSSVMASVEVANAASTTTTLDVTAFVGAACLVSVTPITFNIIDPLAGDTWTTGSVTVTCNPGVPFNILLDAGQNFDGIDRRVADGLGNFGTYWLGSPDLMQGWGDDWLTHPDPSVIATASGSADVFTIDGVFIGGQAIPDGVYNDVVTLTVIY